jgi:hypothetical protein
MPITEAQIEKHRAANPGRELHVIRNDDHDLEILVKAPDDGEWKRFRSMQADDAQKYLAPRALVMGSILEPSATEFTAMLATRPGLAETFAGELIEIAGVSRANTRRKV